MAKKSALYGDFETPIGSFNLFQNAMRQAIEYDANTSDLFEAKVLTRPTLTSNAQISVYSAETISELSRQYVCMVRIRGNLSPHKFLRDPCEISDTSTPEQRRKVFNLIQQHTKVSIFGNENNIPEIGDIIQIRLERGAFGSFKTETAEYVGILANYQESSVTFKQECETALSKFKTSDFVQLSSFMYGEKKWNGKTPPQQEVDRIYEVWLATNDLTYNEIQFEKCGLPGGDFPFEECSADGLHPDFQSLVDKAINSVNPTLKIVSGKRTLKEQISLRLQNQLTPSSTQTLTDENILYASANMFDPPTAPLPKGSYGTGSRHLYGLAVDFGAPLLASTEEQIQNAKDTDVFKKLKEFENKNDNFKNLKSGKEPWHWSFDGG